MARFYVGGGPEYEVDWYFVPDDTPFLPVPSIINSLNWVDVTERIDYGTAGEVAGAARPWSPGNRDISLNAVSYCGTPANWLGFGTIPPAPLPVNSAGNPTCCGDPLGPLEVDMHYIINPYWVDSFPPNPSQYFLLIQVSSTWSFEFLYALGNTPTGWPWQLDLVYDNPNGSGTNDYASDFSVCDFPGYTPLPVVTTLVTPTGSPGQEMTPNYTFSQVGPSTGPDPGAIAIGFMVTDSFGFVVYYAFFGFPQTFSNNGDYLSFNIQYQILSDYY
jgi:hypothetical protein